MAHWFDRQFNTRGDVQHRWFQLVFPRWVGAATFGPGSGALIHDVKQPGISANRLISM